MYPHTVALAQRLNKKLVIYDLEHSGGTKENRAITELAALVVHPDGRLDSYASLVKPGKNTKFLPMICSLTGIWPSMLKKAPAWFHVANEFVLPHQDAVWVGFNSRACDARIILEECARHEIPLATLKLQLDLMRVGKVKGKLAARVESLVPDFDTDGAHRAAKDALMTLVLLEALLPSLDDTALIDQGLLPRPPKLPKVKPVRELPAEPVGASASEPVTFLAGDGESRRGQTWTAGETNWVVSGFKAGKTIQELALSVGRSAVSMMYVLARYGLMEMPK